MCFRRLWYVAIGAFVLATWMACSVAAEDPSHWIEILREGTSDAKRQAREALIAIGGEAVPSLIEATRDPAYLVRWEAIGLLGKLAVKDPQTLIAAIPALVERATRDENPHPRYYSFPALSMYPVSTIEEEVIPRLWASLETEDDLHRWYTTVALALFKQSAIADRLNQGLDREQTYERWEALFSLGYVHNAESLPLVVDILLDSVNTDELLRKEAALTLGKMSDLAAVPALIVALRDPSPGVRCRVALALKNLAGTSALPELEAALDREDDPLARAEMERVIAQLR